MSILIATNYPSKTTLLTYLVSYFYQLREIREIGVIDVLLSMSVSKSLIRMSLLPVGYIDSNLSLKDHIAHMNVMLQRTMLWSP